MGDSTSTRKVSSKLAEKAADAFLSGNVIGGVGIAGILCLFLSIFVFKIGISGIAIDDPELYIGFFLGLSGIALLILSGALYAIKIRLKGNILLSLIEGYNNISIALIQKVKEGTVNSLEVIELSEKHYHALETLVLP
jgi:hypothetical protein